MLKSQPVAAMQAGVLLTLMAGIGVLWVLLAQHYGVAGATGITLVSTGAALGLPQALAQATRRMRVLIGHLAWWHGLWLLLFLTGLVFRERDLTAIRETPLDAWAVYRIGLVCIVGLALVARLALRRTDWLPSLSRGLVGALAIYAMIAGASTLWSVYPAWTLYKALEYCVDLALLAAVLATVASTESYKSLMDWTWVLFAGLLASVWLGAFLWPERAFLASGELFPRRLAGVLPALDQNSVGDLAAVLSLVALARLLFSGRNRQGRAFYTAVFAAGVLTLVFSQTRGAIVGFLLGMLLVLLFSKRWGVLTLVVVLVVLLVSLTAAGEWLAGYWQRGERSEDLEAYSGRLPLWQLAWEKMQQRPLLGAGAYAGGRFGALQTVEDTSLSSALNAYVEIALGTGILGLGSVLAALAGTWWLLLRSGARCSLGWAERALAVEAAGVLTMITVRSFFTVQFVWHPSLDFLVVLGYAEFLRRSQAAAPHLSP